MGRDFLTEARDVLLRGPSDLADPLAAETPFDFAYAAAIFAGWTGEAAFHACCCMRAHGMFDREVELSFLDSLKRIQ